MNLEQATWEGRFDKYSKFLAVAENNIKKCKAKLYNHHTVQLILVVVVVVGLGRNKPTLTASDKQLSKQTPYKGPISRSNINHIRYFRALPLQPRCPTRKKSAAVSRPSARHTVSSPLPSKKTILISRLHFHRDIHSPKRRPLRVPSGLRPFRRFTHQVQKQSKHTNLQLPKPAHQLLPQLTLLKLHSLHKNYLNQLFLPTLLQIQRLLFRLIPKASHLRRKKIANLHQHIQKVRVL